MAPEKRGARRAFQAEGTPRACAKALKVGPNWQSGGKPQERRVGGAWAWAFSGQGVREVGSGQTRQDLVGFVLSRNLTFMRKGPGSHYRTLSRGQADQCVF